MHTHKRTHWLTVIPAGTSPSGPGGQQTGKQHCWYFSCTGTYLRGRRTLAQVCQSCLCPSHLIPSRPLKGWDRSHQPFPERC